MMPRNSTWSQRVGQKLFCKWGNGGSEKLGFWSRRQVFQEAELGFDPGHLTPELLFLTIAVCGLPRSWRWPFRKPQGGTALVGQ